MRLPWRLLQIIKGHSESFYTFVGWTQQHYCKPKNCAWPNQGLRCLIFFILAWAKPFLSRSCSILSRQKSTKWPCIVRCILLKTTVWFTESLTTRVLKNMHFAWGLATTITTTKNTTTVMFTSNAKNAKKRIVSQTLNCQKFNCLLVIKRKAPTLSWLVFAPNALSRSNEG